MRPNAVWELLALAMMMTPQQIKPDTIMTNPKGLYFFNHAFVANEKNGLNCELIVRVETVHT